MSYADAGVVFVVDDDPSVRSSLKVRIGSIGLQVESFDSETGRKGAAYTFSVMRTSEWPSSLDTL